MKYVDEFRDRKKCQLLCDRILKRATRRWTIMEVCGGQTHGLLRYGIEESLMERVELVHGPGCPVCVTSIAAIDQAIALSFSPAVIVATFGDMLRVPGEEISLLQAQALGGKVRTVYSPLDAVQMAASQPDKQVIFLAVGFETTLPATAIAILQAASRKLPNFFVLLSHVRVAPAMQYILEHGAARIDGFLAAGHVTTITGTSECGALANRFRVPIVVTGFEPVDLLMGIEECVRLLEANVYGIVNQYRRVVCDAGNIPAQAAIAEVFEVEDQDWRGLGLVPQGGFRLKEKYGQFDASVLHAEARLATPLLEKNTKVKRAEHECLSGEVLIGKIKPTECPLFGVKCTPQTPLGAPMVSSEGSCAAYYQYAARPVNREYPLSSGDCP